MHTLSALATYIKFESGDAILTNITLFFKYISYSYK